MEALAAGYLASGSGRGKGKGKGEVVTSKALRGQGHRQQGDVVMSQRGATTNVYEEDLEQALGLGLLGLSGKIIKQIRRTISISTSSVATMTMHPAHGTSRLKAEDSMLRSKRGSGNLFS